MEPDDLGLGPDVVYTDDGNILTEEGVLTPSEYATRMRAGTASAPVAESELLAQRAEELREENADAPLTTFIEEAASSATFGLTDVLGDTSERELIERRRRQQYNPTAALAGGITGAVLPGILSGGTGFLGTAARLTPAGKVAAMATRITGNGGIGRAIIGGGIEGAVGAAGDFVARNTLAEDPDWSGEALAKSVVGGALLGGVVGAGADVAARGLGKVATRRGLAKVGQLGEEAVEESSSKVLRTLSPDKGAKTNWSKLAKKQVATDDAVELRKLGTHLDDVSRASPMRELEEITHRFQPGDLPADVSDLVRRATAQAQEVEQATARAKAAWTEFADVAGLKDAKKRVTNTVPDEIEGRLVDELAYVDQAVSQYHRLADEAFARLEIPRTLAPGAPTVARAKAGEAMEDAAEKAGMFSRFKSGVSRTYEAGTSVLGGAELLGMDVPGVPSARNLPEPLGIAMSYYLQYKGLKAAAKGAGLVRASKATKAAETSVGLGERLQAKLGDYAVRGAKAIAKSPRTPLAAAAAAEQISQVRSQSPAAAAAEVQAALDDVDPDVALAAANATQRALEHLQQNAPKDPRQMSVPGMSKWRPTQQQAVEWQRRSQAVADPELAMDRILTSPVRGIELQVLREVYPTLWQTFRARLDESAEQLRKSLNPYSFAALGRDLGLPWSISDLPDYPGADAMPEVASQPQTQFTPPSTPSASPSVTLESTDPARSR